MYSFSQISNLYKLLDIIIILLELLVLLVYESLKKYFYIIVEHIIYIITCIDLYLF